MGVRYDQRDPHAISNLGNRIHGYVVSNRLIGRMWHNSIFPQLQKEKFSSEVTSVWDTWRDSSSTRPRKSKEKVLILFARGLREPRRDDAFRPLKHREILRTCSEKKKNRLSQYDPYDLEINTLLDLTRAIPRHSYRFDQTPPLDDLGRTQTIVKQDLTIVEKH